MIKFKIEQGHFSLDVRVAHRVIAACVRSSIHLANQLFGLQAWQVTDSPDLNPIELAFSKLKTLLRKFGERTREDLWNRIGQLVDQFTPNECRNYFRH